MRKGEGEIGKSIIIFIKVIEVKPIIRREKWKKF